MVSDNRLYFLDGIRGWNAIVVVLFHIFIQCFPLAEHLTNPQKLQELFFLNGELAIWIFFIISGFSLSIGFIQKNDPAIIKRIILARYLRLAPPIFASSLIIYAGFLFNVIPDINIRPEAFKHYLLVTPMFWDVFSFSFFDVFFSYNYSTTLNSPLWTMHYEMIGSIIIFFILFFRN